MERNWVKIEKNRTLFKRLMGWTPKDDSVNENGVFSDVDPKSVWTPAPDRLNCGKRCTCFCKRSSAARTHGLSGDLTGKKSSKTRHEPIMGGNSASGGEPELRMDWELGVPRSQISQEWIVRVCGGVQFLDNYCISFEEPISLVRWQEERILLR